MGEREHCRNPFCKPQNAQLPTAQLMKGGAMFATIWRRLSHRDGLHHDVNPRREHAEAVAQWQSRALRLMWAAAFGFALWHSGDSRSQVQLGAEALRAPRSLSPSVLISINDERLRT